VFDRIDQIRKGVRRPKGFRIKELIEGTRLKRFVLDASIALAWFLDQPIAPIASKARRALIDGSRAMVPALCPFEIANGFAVAERRALITEPEANQSLLELDHLLVQAIDISNEMILAPRLLTLARAFRLSAYDAA
jgi:predicted nucleic acid-binding protein